MNTYSVHDCGQDNDITMNLSWDMSWDVGSATGWMKYDVLVLRCVSCSLHIFNNPTECKCHNLIFQTWWHTILCKVMVIRPSGSHPLHPQYALWSGGHAMARLVKPFRSATDRNHFLP